MIFKVLHGLSHASLTSNIRDSIIGGYFTSILLVYLAKSLHRIFIEKRSTFSCQTPSNVICQWSNPAWEPYEFRKRFQSQYSDNSYTRNKWVRATLRVKDSMTLSVLDPDIHFLWLFSCITPLGGVRHNMVLLELVQKR